MTMQVHQPPEQNREPPTTHNEDAAQLPKRAPPKLNSPMDDKSVAWKGYARQRSNSECSSAHPCRSRRSLPITLLSYALLSAFCHDVLQLRFSCEDFQLLKA